MLWKLLIAVFLLLICHEESRCAWINDEVIHAQGNHLSCLELHYSIKLLFLKVSGFVLERMISAEEK